MELNNFSHVAIHQANSCLWHTHTFRRRRMVLQSLSGLSLSVSPRLLQLELWCWSVQQTHTPSLSNFICRGDRTKHTHTHKYTISVRPVCNAGIKNTSRAPHLRLSIHCLRVTSKNPNNQPKKNPDTTSTQIKPLV